jgi:carboxypeptidase C (cathepsin A)
MHAVVPTLALTCALFVGRAIAQQPVPNGDSCQRNGNNSVAAAKPPERDKKVVSVENAKATLSSIEDLRTTCRWSGSGNRKEEEYDVTEVVPVATHHVVTVDGKLMKYVATAGRLPIKREDGRIEAEMFFVAYTLDDQNVARRPLTFAFNGGPGSATIWLHMGALGPRRVQLNPDGSMPPPPYAIADNPYTLLDKSDLVLVDAIGTGFSRAANPELSKQFWGVKGDIAAFSEFIRMYLTRYARWRSPLFLIGESYGTTRAAGIAGKLADQGISFNGITLIATGLSFQTLVANKSNDLAYILLLPTFTMTAGYHKKLPPDLQQDMAKARQESMQWASSDYTLALSKGDALVGDERKRVIDQMARYTGLSKQVIDAANLRIDEFEFTYYLLLDQKLRVGALDGRLTGPDPDGVLETQFYDPTLSSILPPYVSVFNDYIRTELGYATDMPYDVLAADPNFENIWNWGSARQGFPDTAIALREAMMKNPYLKVLVMEGYYDLTTPFYAATYTINHLNLNSVYRDNISFATYEAGHMVYLPMDGLRQMKKDEAAFLNKSVNESALSVQSGSK